MIGLSTKRDIKMAGYWPSSFLCGYGQRQSGGQKLRKTRINPIPEKIQNKGFIVWKKNHTFLRDKAGYPEQKKYLHLACSGSQSQGRIHFILPAPSSSHIITHITDQSKITSLATNLLFSDRKPYPG